MTSRTDITALRALKSLPEQHERRSNVAIGERWASLIIGNLLTLYGLTRRSPIGIGMALLGGGLIYRAASGRCQIYQALGINTADRVLRDGIHVEVSTTINRSIEEVYACWRHVENLPLFMEHLDSVVSTDERRSHWIAKGPFDLTVEWEAEIVADLENQLIAWRSLPGSEIETYGTVHFQPASADRGTELHIKMQYKPAAGPISEAAAQMLHGLTEHNLREDLRRYKQVLESGEITTVQGQPSGRAAHQEQQKKKPHMLRNKDLVVETSEESFPASDPPAWTSGREDEQEREVGA